MPPQVRFLPMPAMRIAVVVRPVTERVVLREPMQMARPAMPPGERPNTGQRSCTCCRCFRSSGVPVASTGIPNAFMTAFRPHSALNPYIWSALAQRASSNSSSASSQCRRWASTKSAGCAIGRCDPRPDAVGEPPEARSSHARRPDFRDLGARNGVTARVPHPPTGSSRSVRHPMATSGHRPPASSLPTSRPSTTTTRRRRAGTGLSGMSGIASRAGA